MNNAVKFANPKDPTIILKAYKKNGGLHISIEDNGK
ncbi:ATP-binding protein [bacterium]|nr:ATP-binding protein [bacterium]